MPLDKYAWSERYGWVQDKFGMTWQLMLARGEDKQKNIVPSLMFTNKNFGRAEEAIQFYCKTFPNSENVAIVPFPQGDANAGKIMFSEFKIDDNLFIAMDGPGEHTFNFNEALSFVVNCKTQKEIDFYWDTLISDGGAESRCGWLKDKFGVSWQIIPEILGSLMSNPEKGGRVMQEILKMNKINIEILEKA